MYERECMYKAALLLAEKNEIRLMQMRNEERKRGREGSNPANAVTWRRVAKNNNLTG